MNRLSSQAQLFTAPGRAPSKRGEPVRRSPRCPPFGDGHLRTGASTAVTRAGAAGPPVPGGTRSLRRPPSVLACGVASSTIGRGWRGDESILTRRIADRVFGDGTRSADRIPPSGGPRDSRTRSGRRRFRTGAPGLLTVSSVRWSSTESESESNSMSSALDRTDGQRQPDQTGEAGRIDPVERDSLRTGAVVRDVSSPTSAATRPTSRLTPPARPGWTRTGRSPDGVDQSGRVRTRLMAPDPVPIPFDPRSAPVP